MIPRTEQSILEDILRVDNMPLVIVNGVAIFNRKSIPLPFEKNPISAAANGQWIYALDKGSLTAISENDDKIHFKVGDEINQILPYKQGVVAIGKNNLLYICPDSSQKLFFTDEDIKSVVPFNDDSLLVHTNDGRYNNLFHSGKKLRCIPKFDHMSADNDTVYLVDAMRVRAASKENLEFRPGPGFEIQGRPTLIAGAPHGFYAAFDTALGDQLNIIKYEIGQEPIGRYFGRTKYGNAPEMMFYQSGVGLVLSDFESVWKGGDLAKERFFIKDALVGQQK